MRLIDENRLYDCLMLEYQNGEIGSMDDVAEIIASQPTAYDVDNVVEQLNTKAMDRIRKSTSPFDSWSGMAVGYKDSVSVVKAGGINADNN